MHSATPWHSDNNDGYSITRIYPARKTQYISIVAEVIGDSAEAEDNAALIVKAVNSYEAMKEALNQISNGGTTKYSRDPFDHAVRCIENMKDIARKALALAEGKE